MLDFFAGETASILIAEVSDKFPSMAEYWYTAIPIALGLMLAGFIRWWLGAIFAIFPIFIFLGSVDLAFNSLGRALYREQGIVFFINIFASDILMLFASGAGIYLGYRRIASR